MEPSLIVFLIFLFVSVALIFQILGRKRFASDLSKALTQIRSGNNVAKSFSHDAASQVITVDLYLPYGLMALCFQDDELSWLRVGGKTFERRDLSMEDVSLAEIILEEVLKKK